MQPRLTLVLVLAALPATGCGTSDGDEAPPGEADGRTPPTTQGDVQCDVNGVCEDGMVRIEGGTFIYGLDESDPNWGRCLCSQAEEATVSTFRIDQTEVLAEDYAGCVSDGPCTPPTVDEYCDKAIAGDKRPANCVSYLQATTYCDWVGKRLPTEREWEYAAGGRQGFRFPWGDEASREEVCDFNKTGYPCEAGSFEAGANRLFDMAGNVAEWTVPTASCSPESETSELCVREGENPVRGGSCSDEVIEKFLVAYRGIRPLIIYGDPDPYNNVGFRCAQDE